MLQKALDLASQGFRVFPVAKDSKSQPLIKGWNTKATTDTAQIKKWWQRLPEANIGIVPGPDYFVFDVDMRTGARESVEKLKSLKLPPETLTVRTPSGGYHLYYKHPGGGVIKAKDKQWMENFPGIDIRADNAYVMAPGSAIGEKPYKLESDKPIARLPSTIVREIPYKERISGEKSITDQTAEKPSQFGKLPKVIKVGERDSIMFSYVCSLVGREESKKQITKKAKAAFELCEQPADNPFPWSAVESMIERAISGYGTVSPDVLAQSAPEELPAVLKKALKTYVLVEDGSYVADLSAHPSDALLKLTEWKASKSNIWIAKCKKPLSNVWLTHSQRLTAFSANYHPGMPRLFKRKGRVYYNTYVPPDVEPKKGELHKPALDHIKYIFEGDRKNIEYFLFWMAFTVKYPEKRIPWAPIIISIPGTGKGWFLDLFRKLLGNENCQFMEPSALTDQRINFNEWWGGTLLWIDEVDPRYDFCEKLKPIITASFGTINIKYGKKEQRDIYCNVMATSNHVNALKVDENDRRWWVIHSKVKPRSPEYYAELFKWLETEGPAHFLYFLTHLNISTFNHAAPPPVTRAKQEMIEESRSEIETCIRDAVEFKTGPLAFDIVSTEIASIYVRNQLGLDKLNWGSQKQIGFILRQFCTESLPQNQYVVNLGSVKKRLRLILIRNPERWCKTSSEQIVEHYMKAHEAAL